MNASHSLAAPPPPTPARRACIAANAPTWRDWLALALILLPALFCALLVKANAVNAPFFDDFTFSEDWLRFKTGQFTWSDLFSVHLEHRVTVPRLLALGAHFTGGADIRWQNGLAILLILGTLANILAIWRRTTGVCWSAGWIPLSLISATLFCAVQWQPLLWAILFEIFVASCCLSLALRMWAGPMNPWTALALSAALCVAAMLSFGNGPLLWLLIPFGIWFQRPGLGRATRAKLIAVWLACFAASVALYSHNFHNSAAPQFAYNFDERMTAIDTVGASLKKLLDPASFQKVIGYFFALLGSHLCRGLHLHNLLAAQWIGGVSCGLFLAATVCLLLRREPELLRKAAPWVLLGAFSIGTAALITLGRVWLTRSGVTALLPRYVSHAIPLSVALIGLAWIIGETQTGAHPWLRTAGIFAAGAFFFLVLSEWIYGARQMNAWRYARLQGVAMLKFADVMPNKQFLGPLGGDGGYVAGVISELNRIGQSPVPLLKSLRLDQFHVSRLALRRRQAAFLALHDTSEGGLFAVGYSELPDQRPADLILFSARDAGGIEQIFGFTYALRLPNYLHAASYKDHDYLSMREIDPDLYARWEGNISLARKPPRGTGITAWALDVVRNVVHRIPDERAAADPLPPLPARPADAD